MQAVHTHRMHTTHNIDIKSKVNELKSTLRRSKNTRQQMNDVVCDAKAHCNTVRRFRTSPNVCV